MERRARNQETCDIAEVTERASGFSTERHKPQKSFFKTCEIVLNYKSFADRQRLNVIPCEIFIKSNNNVHRQSTSHRPLNVSALT